MISNKKSETATVADVWLRTEGPLCEKDEQARTVELLRKQQDEAAKRWSALQAAKKQH